jgi:hypothetical protein
MLLDIIHRPVLSKNRTMDDFRQHNICIIHFSLFLVCFVMCCHIAVVCIRDNSVVGPWLLSLARNKYKIELLLLSEYASVI